MKLLADKVVLITGASQGIGKGIAIRCAEQGAQIAFTYIYSPEKAKEVENELNELGVKAKSYHSDAADFDACQKLAQDVLSDFGQIDVLVNNAGITKDGLLMRMSEQDWDDVLRINLKSIFNTTKAVQRTMLKQRKGSIINLSSVVGVNGNAGQSNYAASKAGMIGFTKSMAKELGSRNIRSNAIAPGFIATEMTAKLDPDVVENWVKEIPLKRAGAPEDVADVVVFLASDMSAYVTGQTIHVCGGMLT
ncbi:MAG: 3-oxoacyl-[acyl-carrier-protein] reductase [Flavobacteriales bacterium]|nr:3-oxoacyl-[acyl-carrier-protein] reductase [Flavobacteriales bacterium]